MSELPDCMKDGWDPETPGREWRDRILASWKAEGYFPTPEEVAELD